MPIHPSAIVDPEAWVDETAIVGPYCIVGAGVTIGARTELKAHVYLEGPTWLGDENLVYPYVSIGVASQDQKYKGEYAETRIGHRNKIREFVTVHRGTEGGGAKTIIGDDNLLLAYAHIAHDANIGSHCILGNGVTLAGHVTIGEWAVISAFSGIHQFCRIGRHAMVGGYSVITQDVMPFATVVTPREAKSFGANAIGLERRGFHPAVIENLQNALRLLTRGKLNTSQAIDKIREEIPDCPEVEELIDFIRSSERGVIK
ncbi:MAG TPA: acyl-ACP--UDP-N-acetylglucosamine O-acyltransferase [Bryobacteraceae bacterium]|nr:acyl-ACP--UDP-N-acetylglucosamine O-acyltransferase [Bryobacteraceae bacterium]